MMMGAIAANRRRGGGAATFPQYVGGVAQAFPGSAGGAAATMSLAGTLTGGLASTAAQDDLVIVSLAMKPTADNNLSLTTAGYSEVADLYSPDSLDAALGVYHKFMGAVPDTDVSFNRIPSTGIPSVLIAQVYRGVNLASPMDVAAVTAVGGNSGHPNPPAITPASPGALIVVCAAASALNGGATLSQSGSELSNFLAVYGDNSNATNDDITAAMGSKEWGGGAFDPVALSGNTSTSLAWAAVTLALRPA